MRAVAHTAELVAGFEPESDLERAVAEDPELANGLRWGAPRTAHPEGSVAAHVVDLLSRLDRLEVSDERRRRLRFLVLVHDAFKYRVTEHERRVGENHHAMRARRFAERYTDDEGLLSAIELHDLPYELWRRCRREGRLDEAAFERMMRRVADLGLFARFVELDGSTDGKRPEPVRWFLGELERRGCQAA